VSVVGVAGWPVIVTGWPVNYQNFAQIWKFFDLTCWPVTVVVVEVGVVDTRYGVSQPGADAER